MAESKGFDLSALIKSVPDLGTDRQQIEYIPIEKIDPDPENFYSLDGLNELAGSIEMLGLQQALLLRPGENGHYTLISGHRRRAAILMIRDGGSDQFKDGVPCVVDRRNASKALWKFQLLMANKDTRKMTSADENRQAEELENVLRELEDAGYEFPGRLRDWVSELSGMSRSKLNRLKVIREKLAPEIKTKYYDTGKLNENTAYTLAKMEPELQLKLFKASQNATAAGSDADCVSRSFCPKLSIPEDPVCGSAHCQIADYWAGVLGKEDINVDIILQSIGRDDTKDISFTVKRDDAEKAADLLNEYKESIGFDHIDVDKEVVKVSIVGAGMVDDAGVAAKMFGALYDADVNIQMISTSEIKVSVLLDENDANAAVQAIHDKFFGE